MAKPALLLRSFVLAALLGSVALPAAQARDAGAYLAGRVAAAQDDYDAAAQYYERLMAEGENDPVFIEGALVAEIGRNQMEAALPIAEALGVASETSQIGALLLLADAVRAGDFDKAINILDERGDQWPMGPELFRAWIDAGRGKMSDAMKSFDAAAAEPGLKGFALYHKAVALAMVGDYEGADEILSSDVGPMIEASRRGALAHAQVLSQLERNADALAVLDRAFGAEGGDAEIMQIRADLAGDKMLPFTIVNTAPAGVAEVYFTLGSALAGEMPGGFPLMFTRIANWLRPDHSDATLISASILEDLGQYDLAIATFSQITPEHPAYAAAEIGRAEALMQADKPDAAIEALESLSRSNGDTAGVWVALGDTLRREERYGDAAAAYDKAVDILGDPQPKDWFVWYARAISQERSDQWDKAEAGFRKALELNPNQPSVLNYLGYSYVEKGENLDEALSMISQAVKAQPDAGYIVDSLGWALYRLGRYEEAVGHMERAVELEAVDPLVNDHLGDVYWAVGRAREAEFQWKRALSFGPGDDMDMERVRRKIAVGLDKVLEEEGAPPLARKGE